MTSPDQERWLRVKEKLRAEVGEDIFQSWFARMDLERIEVNTAHLSVPTRFLKSWIQSHYTDRVLACWQGENERYPEDRCRRAQRRHQDRAPKVKPPELTQPHRDPRIGRLDIGELRAVYAPVSTGHDALGGSPLDLRLTFESFVIGRSNTLAHAAAKQVALARRGEPVMFNPLYIHAGVGLGKTHLLQATTWAGNNGADRKVLYLTAEKFMYGFVSALRTQTALAFKEALRGIDVLVIDDLQFLQGKSTQAEFCHTLNALIDAGRQVVIAADRPPTDLESLDDRDAIAARRRARRRDGRRSAKTCGWRFSRPASPRRGNIIRASTFRRPVLAYIAKSVTHNGRDLEGAVNRLLAHNKLTGQPVTMEMAEREVRDLIRPQEPKRVKIEDIQRIVARQYNVSRADLLSSRRTANVVRPRQVAMYLAKTLTLRSLPEIGRRFGGRDHTTVLHAVRKIEGLVGNDAMLADEIEVLKRQLQE